MEMQEFRCPCGAILTVSPSQIGEQIVCSSCQMLLKIPSLENYEEVEKEQEIDKVCPSCHYVGTDISCPHCATDMIEIVSNKKEVLRWIIPFLTFIFGFLLGIFL